MSGAASAAREAARKGRVEQLKVLTEFEKGKPVVFKIHNNSSGFPLKKDEVPPKPRSGKKGINFTPEDRLMDAAVMGDPSEVRQLVEAGTDPNIRDADGLTPLHRACVENHLPIVSYLVGKGANVNVIDRDWWTPLHAAASAGNWRVVNFLITHGASVKASNADGDLPIDVISDSKVEAIIKREMERLGIKEDDLDSLRLAPEHQMLADVEEAVAKGGDLNFKNSEGGAPLHVACCNGWLSVAKLLLLQPTVKINARDAEGNTPLHLAAFFQHYEIVLLLAAQGADLTARNCLSEKPIVVTEDDTMIRLLSALEKKAKTGKIDAPAGKSRGRSSTASINRSTREKKRAAVRKDSANEGMVISKETGGSLANTS